MRLKMKAEVLKHLHHYRRVYYWTIASWLFVFFTFSSILIFSDLPEFSQLENPENNVASEIYDIHGVPFGKYYVENRVPVHYEDLSPHLIKSVILTEDARFHQHNGVDVKAVFRVGFKTILLHQKSSGGGSTISQQLAKLLFKRPDLRGKNKFTRTLYLIHIKLKEWITAVRIERNYTKEEILAMYLNKFEFINGAHGIHSASNVYFGKDPKSLTIEESATLAGMLQNPSYYNPVRFPARCKERRNLVLDILARKNYISPAQKDSLSKPDMDMSAFKSLTQSEGPAPYFRAELTKFVKFVLSKKGIKKPDGTDYNVYTDGLKIYTTIDLTYQKYAEQAVFEHMKWNQNRFFRIWKNKDPWTYEADDAQKRIRLKMLENKNKGSERYLSMRQYYLSALLNKCTKKYPGISLSDHAISSMDSLPLKKNIRQIEFFKKMTEQEVNDYTNLYESELWKPLKHNYEKLQDHYKKVFSTPVKMKIFDYSETRHKEVIMSPFDSVRYHSMILQAGVLAIDPASGHIKAWVGGIDHTYFKFDHVTMRRSVGSTIKPMVYTQAMAVQGISPCQEFDDIQYTIYPGDANFEVNMEWSPANATESFTGNKYNLFHGLLYSKNSITVKLVKEMGSVAPIRDLLHHMGIDKDTRLSNGKLAVPNLPSICLGAVELTPLEMTGAYTTFANNGTFSKPVFVTRIENKFGKVLYTGISEKKPAINRLYNSVMVEMLKNNVANRFSMNVKSEVGGKTGTTNDYSDAWFMGITPQLVIGVWTGADDKWIRFLSLNDGEGYTNARPIAIKILQSLERDTTGIYDYKSNFPKPPAAFADLINCVKYKQISVAGERNTLLQQKLKKEEFDDEF